MTTRRLTPIALAVGISRMLLLRDVAEQKAASRPPQQEPAQPRESPTMIKPTIGRVVWFQPSVYDPTNPDAKLPSQPQAALVAYVHGDRCINVGGFDHNGKPFSACSVQLLQDDDAIPAGGYFAQWMPYQVGQAKVATPVAASAEPVGG